MINGRRNFLYTCVGLSLILTTGYSKTDTVKIRSKKIDFKRDKCTRCSMVIENRSFAAQVINPNTKKHYNFDDIGCAVLWLREQNIPWADEAVIYVSDEKSKKLIDAKTALFTDGSKTPMNYGFGAHKYKISNKKNYTLDEVEDSLEQFRIR